MSNSLLLDPPAPNSARELSSAIVRLYSRERLGTRFMAAGRPFIAPIEMLISLVPAGSTVLDCGCGSGFFLASLSMFRSTQRSAGFDISRNALEAAKRIDRRVVEAGFQGFDVCAGTNADCFARTFDVVSMIDVMHHLPLQHRRTFLKRAMDSVRPGGMFLFKDMAPSPRWRAYMNVLHDLALTRELVRLSPIAEVEQIAAENGFKLVKSDKAYRWWYAHEWRVFTC